LNLPAGVLMVVIFVFITIRAGILAVVTILAVLPLLVLAPLTLDLSRWYAGRGLVLVGAILALTIWAFLTSLGGQRALGSVRLEE
jgi:hypothetical protein